MTDDLTARARTLAIELHAGQTRKGTDLDYVEGHLEPVAQMVRAAGGSDTQVAAAYLHDAAEDAGGRAVLGRIGVEIGTDVASIVEHLSDSLTDTTGDAEKEDWLTRKVRYVDGLRSAPTEVLEVSVADKLHNARAILADYIAVGAELWGRFNEQRPEYQLGYYRSLAKVFVERLPANPLTADLTLCLADLGARVRADVPDLDTRLGIVHEALKAVGRGGADHADDRLTEYRSAVERTDGAAPDLEVDDLRRRDAERLRSLHDD